MRAAAQKLTAITLVALLATLGCFEHLLHEVTYQPAQHTAGGAHSCCHHVQQGACSNEESPTRQHDPGTCTVCRHLALSQMGDEDQHVVFTVFLTSDVVISASPAVTRTRVTLVPIRGPPLNELALSC